MPQSSHLIRLKSFRTYVVCPRTQYINPRAQIRMYDAENVIALLNSHDELMFDHLFDTRKQSAFKQAEEQEPEPKERTMRLLKVAESRGITEAGIRTFEGTDSKQQRAATIIQEPMRRHACFEETVNEKKWCLSISA